MITRARITALREAGDLGWLACLRAPQIAALAKDDGPLQLSLFDETDLAEFTHPDYPGERLIACWSPLLAEERGESAKSCSRPPERHFHRSSPQSMKAAWPVPARSDCVSAR